MGRRTKVGVGWDREQSRRWGEGEGSRVEKGWGGGEERRKREVEGKVRGREEGDRRGTVGDWGEWEGEQWLLKGNGGWEGGGGRRGKKSGGDLNDQQTDKAYA